MYSILSKIKDQIKDAVIILYDPIDNKKSNGFPEIILSIEEPYEIWIPNLDYNKVVELYRTTRHYAIGYKLILDDIYESKIEFTDVSEAFILFCIFHELAHWRHMTEFRNPKEWIAEYKHINYDLGLDNFKSKYNETNDDDKIDFEYQTIYRNHPFEKRADQEALRILKEYYYSLDT